MDRRLRTHTSAVRASRPRHDLSGASAPRIGGVGSSLEFVVDRSVKSVLRLNSMASALQSDCRLDMKHWRQQRSFAILGVRLYLQGSSLHSGRWDLPQSFSDDLVVLGRWRHAMDKPHVLFPLCIRFLATPGNNASTLEYRIDWCLRGAICDGESIDRWPAKCKRLSTATNSRDRFDSRRVGRDSDRSSRLYKFRLL